MRKVFIIKKAKYKFQNERNEKKMKTLKKIVALAMALMMVLSVAVSAVADDGIATASVGTGTVTVTNARSGEQYKLYKIFDIAKTYEGLNVYVTNATWYAFAETISKENTTTDEIEKMITLSPADGNPDYVQTVEFDAVNGLTDKDAAWAQLFAEKVVKWLESNNITPECSTQEFTASGSAVLVDAATSNYNFDYGYYVLVSTNDNAEKKYTVFSLNSDNIDIEEKNSSAGVVKIEKQVKEDDGGAWGKENTAEIGQTVEFKIVLTLAAGTDTYTIVDSMPNFEELKNTKVTYSAGTVTLSDKAADNTDILYSMTEDGFEITLSSGFRVSVEDGATITFEYTAKLKGDATTGKDGNVNTVTLTVSDGDDETEDPEYTASTTTYTGELQVKKVDENGALLEGAWFILVRGENGIDDTTKTNLETLVKAVEAATDENKEAATTALVNALKDSSAILFYTMEEDDHFVSFGAESEDSEGIRIFATPSEVDIEHEYSFAIHGLDADDKYTLVEVKAPDGYIEMADAVVSVSASDNYVKSVVVENLPGIEMPSTGGMGTTIFYVAGGFMVGLAVVCLALNKRKGAAE